MKTALISVSDKEKVVEFARELRKLGIDILSTGGTARVLEVAGINVTKIEDYTEAKEMLDGRVKTLHPKVHAGLLALRTKAAHMKQLTEQQIKPIDIVVVNLYPFEETISNNPGFDKAIENIDIGGPSMLRSAAKNFESVVVVTDIEDYDKVLGELKSDGDVSYNTRKYLAHKVFEKTAYYDNLIAGFLGKMDFPDRLTLSFKKVMGLRYGENPHQKAALYKEHEYKEHEDKQSSVLSAKQLHGKELSYNNIIDLNDAWELVKDFDEPTAAVIKHTNPCGIASRPTIEEAYKTAHEADPMSAFGSIIALNRPCNLKVAEIIKPLFVECVICPRFETDALELLQQKKNIRLLETGEIKQSKGKIDMRKVSGGLLVQTADFPGIDELELKCMTKRKPTEKEFEDLKFAWKLNKHVKSNSVVFVKDKVGVGIGAGQMSRVDSSIIAARKAGAKAKGAVLSSDAFFPFRDGVDEAARAGITAIIQPGGSIRDQEVIDAADEHNIAMVFSGVRLFKH